MTKNIAMISCLKCCNYINLFICLITGNIKIPRRWKRSTQPAFKCLISARDLCPTSKYLQSICGHIPSQGTQSLPQALTFAPPSPYTLSLWRTMMWTWMRKRRERCSWERPTQATGGRTVETVTHSTREEGEAAWWTAAVGPRSSRISSHHRQRTVTVEGEPGGPASLWVTLSFHLGHTSTELLRLSPCVLPKFLLRKTEKHLKTKRGKCASQQ